MSTYLLGRVGSLVVSLLVASIVIFLILEVVPGDPAQFMRPRLADQCGCPYRPADGRHQRRDALFLRCPLKLRHDRDRR